MAAWINSTRLRRELTEVLAGLQDLEEPLTIVHRSRPIGVLWDYERFQRLLERLEDAEDLLMICDHEGEPTIEFEEAMRILEGEPLPVTCHVAVKGLHQI